MRCYEVGYTLLCISVLFDRPHMIYLAALFILINPWSFPPPGALSILVGAHIALIFQLDLQDFQNPFF